MENQLLRKNQQKNDQILGKRDSNVLFDMENVDFEASNTDENLAPNHQ